MDDNLGQPSFPHPRQAAQQQSDEELSDDENEGPDWTKFKLFASSSKPSLPKRGDKEFEPAVNGPTNLQVHSLNRARDAMFGALNAERCISNKSVSYAVWYPSLARARVTQAKGVLFNGMGHSVARSISGTREDERKGTKMHKKTELLPEETLYLIERGSLFCWKDEPTMRSYTQADDEGESGVERLGEHHMRGSPMSVQQAFADMIGREDLTLERYHAYAYLKRLGFNVLRTKPPSPSYPTSPFMAAVTLRPHFLARISQPLINLYSRLKSWLFGRINWWRPLSFGTWLGCARNYPSVYRALRVIPSGHKVHLRPQTFTPQPPRTIEPPTPYEIFFNVYKPNTPFRKSAPPPPDFSLVVVNARTTPLPTLDELTYLWSFLPETGPPPPRQRHHSKPPPPLTKPQPPPPTSSRLFSWLWLSRNDTSNTLPPQRKKSPHPFSILKNGKKTIVIGVVDSGTVGFFRFGMGAFEEMPMI